MHKWELKQYDFYNEDIVEFNHNKIKIKYDIKNMNYKKGKKIFLKIFVMIWKIMKKVLNQWNQIKVFDNYSFIKYSNMI